MLAGGVTHFIELGPRDVLSNLVKRIEREANAATAGDPAGIERLGGGRP
jgi:malonyl CoA-acyl carrier protein transacylase